MLELVDGQVVAAVQGADDASVADDEHAVAQPDELVAVGRRDEHGHAVGNGVLDDRVHLVAGADVDALRRLVEQQHLRLQPEAAPDHHLLLVAARQGGDRRLGAGGDDAEPLDPARRLGALGAAVDAAEAAQVAQAADGEVLAYRHRREQPEPGALARHEGDAGAHRPLRVVRGDRRRPDGHIASVTRALAGQQRDDRLAARAVEPGHADDLADADVGGEVGDVAAGEAARR